MGLFDSLKGALESEALPALLNTVLAQTAVPRSQRPGGGAGEGRPRPGGAGY